MFIKRKLKTPVKSIALAVSCALIHSMSLAQEVEVESAGLEDTIEVIEVKGIRSSQAAAIDLKREAATIVDSIVAEDIGKLPDATIADSLSRISGVQVKREANEATSLNIRGMPQVLTTLNGEQFLSPWTITEVGANYGDIPASMITGVDVYKSISSKFLSGGISGLVDLKTSKPLNLKEGWTGNVRVEGSQGDRSNKVTNIDGSTKNRNPDHSFNAFLGYNQGNKWGFTAGYFDSTSNAANYQMWDDNRLAFLDSQGGQPGDPLDLDNDGDLVNDWYMVPGNFGVRSNFMQRDRQGAAFSFEAQINDKLKFSTDVFYTEMDQYDRGVNINFNAASSINSVSVNNGPEEPTDLYNVLLKDGTLTSEGADISYVDADGNTQTKTIHTIQVAHINSREFLTTSSSSINHTAALNTNVQLDYNNNDNFEASIRYVFAHAEKQYRSAQLQQGTPAWLWIDEDGINGRDPFTVYDVTIDYRGDVPTFGYDSVANDLSQAAILRKYQGFGDGTNTDADLDILRIDGKYFLDSNNSVKSFDFGLRRGVREAHHTKFFYATPTGRYSTYNDTTVPEDKRYRLLPGNEVWQKYPEWRDFYFDLEDANLRAQDDYIDNGFGVDDTAVFTDFGPIQGFENGVSSLDPAKWDTPLAFLNQLYPGTKTIEDPGFTYAVKETSTSAFVQGNFENDSLFFGIPMAGDFGLRVVKTEREITKAVIPAVLDRNNSVGAGSQPWQKIAFVSTTETVENSFTDLLPSFNVNFFPHDDLILRLGASKNMTRNNLENLGSGLVLWYQQCVKTASDGLPVKVRDGSGQLRDAQVGCAGGGDDRGDPNMKPWRATVYNSSAEWYFAENSILGIGVFMIDVETAVAQFQQQRNFADADGINRGRTVNVWTTGNVQASDLMGFEVGYKQPFTFFDNSILSALGVEFNYTYSDSESPDMDVEGNALPLPSNSKHQSNTILWYDKDGLNMRIAYNWRSEEYIGRVGLNTNGVPLNLGNWNESVGYLDAQINYWVNEHFSFSLSGTNLTSQHRKSYAQFENQFQSLWVQERRYTLGMSVSF